MGKTMQEPRRGSQLDPWTSWERASKRNFMFSGILLWLKFVFDALDSHQRCTKLRGPSTHSHGVSHLKSGILPDLPLRGLTRPHYGKQQWIILFTILWWRVRCFYRTLIIQIKLFGLNNFFAVWGFIHVRNWKKRSESLDKGLLVL